MDDSTKPTKISITCLIPRFGAGGGAEDNEVYGGISIKHKKVNMRKSEFLMLEALKSAPHLNDTSI